MERIRFGKADGVYYSNLFVVEVPFDLYFILSAGCFLEFLTALALLNSRSALFFALGSFEFALEAQVVFPSAMIEMAYSKGCSNGATGFVLVFAIAKSTLAEEVFNVLKARSQTGFVAPHMECAHTGCVYDETSCG